MPVPYPIFRTRRKTIQIQIDRHGEVTVRAPLRMPSAAIERFIQQHADWIAQHTAAQKARDARRHIPSAHEAAALRQAAEDELPAWTARWAQTMGVAHTGVKITSAAHRWGSCSARNRICYSWRVMFLPPALREYIIVHELAHIRVKNHILAFYAEVARWLPDYRQRIAALRTFEQENPLG